ncbi:Arc-like DNA binding domain-containing protein [Fulvimarina manganoxydans]|uniref:Arc-like DNA binding domain-containing protein n=1 Tax=Fulvimarina manganoxydans TaxID=937218 RepID=A0A1W1Z0Q1_9HYPH|nr:Arc family DNA-binding protein [Fulvimarina manganoxydans]SMC41538.1 Arc-like DNA binding domain-containing protein [Fulvimarina manganoxydans]
MGDNQSKPDQYQLRFPDGLRDRLKDAAAANHRSMNSEIVARLLASFGESISEPEAAPMERITAQQGDPQIKFRFPTWMHEAVKARADANGRSMNAEVSAIVAAALNGEDDRLARIEAKLDALLNGGAA